MGLSMEMLPQPSAKYMGFGEYDIISHEEESRSLRELGDVVSMSLPEVVTLAKVEEKLEQDVYKRPDQVRSYVNLVRATNRERSTEEQVVFGATQQR